MAAACAPAPTGDRHLCISLHDVAPIHWARCVRIRDAIAAVTDAPVTLLVTPRFHGRSEAEPAYVAWLDARRERGDELALHGWSHLDDGPAPRTLADRLRRHVYCAQEGEFAAIDADAARLRLAAGRAWFARHGWPVEGFVAPAWLLGADSRRAVHGAGLRYTTTLRRFYALEADIAIVAQPIVYASRTRLRRIGSLAWNAALAARLRDAPLVRIALHPADCDHRRVMDQAIALVTRFAATHRAVTKAAFAGLLAARERQLHASPAR